MKDLTNMIITALLLILASQSIMADRLAQCRGPLGGAEFSNCPDCKAYEAEGVTPLDDGVEDTLWTCNGKPLNVAECAHQCVCYVPSGGLGCRAWEGCSADTVHNFCKCNWQGDNTGGYCKAGSENKLWKDGGMCYCSGHYTEGSPPHD